MWGEVWDSAESLASLFEALFAIANRDEEVLESMFRFVSKHVSKEGNRGERGDRGGSIVVGGRRNGSGPYLLFGSFKLNYNDTIQA